MKIRNYVLLGLVTICIATSTIFAITENPNNNISNVSFKKLRTLKGHKDIVQSMKILKNGSLISGSADTTIKIWTMDGTCTKQLNNVANEIVSLTELADGQIGCCSTDGTINFLDNTNGTRTILANLQKEQIHANHIIQLQDGNIAFSTQNRTIKVWDINKDTCLKTITTEPHNAWISSLIELKNSHYLATSSWDKTIKIWDISQDESPCIKTLKGHTDCINEIKQLNDQMFVSAADDKTIMVWDIAFNNSTATLHGHNDKVYTLLIVHEKIISGSHDKTVKIWDPTLMNCIATIPCKDKVYSLAFSSNTQCLFVGLGCGDIEVFQLFF